MNEWKCTECVKHGTDACFNGGKFDYDECKYMLIDVDYAYEKGREDAINECLSIVEHELKDTTQPRFDWCTLWRSLWKKFKALKEKKDE